MVSFPANSQVFDQWPGDLDAVRIDAILPDVRRRYGLATYADVVRPAGQALPEACLWRIAEFRNEAPVRQD